MRGSRTDQVDASHCSVRKEGYHLGRLVDSLAVGAVVLLCLCETIGWEQCASFNINTNDRRLGLKLATDETD